MGSGNEHIKGSFGIGGCWSGSANNKCGRIGVRIRNLEGTLHEKSAQIGRPLSDWLSSSRALDEYDGYKHQTASYSQSTPHEG